MLLILEFNVNPRLLLGKSYNYHVSLQYKNCNIARY
jgi:hypothetical protein